MNIADLRRRIDAIDRALVRLLNQRARCSLAVGRKKQGTGVPLFSRARERQIAENARRLNRGPLPDRAVVELYAMLLRLTRRAVRDYLRREKRAGKSGGPAKKSGRSRRP